MAKGPGDEVLGGTINAGDETLEVRDPPLSPHTCELVFVGNALSMLTWYRELFQSSCEQSQPFIPQL